jgi:CHAD domain-containing protein
MAYAFERDEPVPAGVLRIMSEQLVRAREQLTDSAAPPDQRVHDARKRFKETRALLRAVRAPLGEQYPLENAWFRDAGRDLAAVRDADAVLEALQKLELPRLVRMRVKRALKKERTHPPLEGLIANTLDQLVIAQARLALWPALPDSFDALAAGLLRTYRGGRRAMKRAKTPAQFHEWRKHAKTHWYHVQLLRQLWPTLMKASAAELDALSHALGDHHDLHVLATSITTSPPELLAAIAIRQQKLEKDAAELGARIYAESPKSWLARMRKYWSAWRPH